MTQTNQAKISFEVNGETIYLDPNFDINLEKSCKDLVSKSTIKISVPMS